MQKKQNSLLVAASLVAAAVMVFIACGDGALIDLEKNVDLINKLDEGEAKLHTVADSIYDGIKDGSVPIEESSSSEEEISSSSDEPEPPPSSNSQYSSSSVQQQQEPSSSSKPGSSNSNQVSSSRSSSSSSKPPTTTGGCQASNPKSGFTCAWSISGSSTTPGKELKVGTHSGEGDCTIAWKYADNDDDMTLMNGCLALEKDEIIETEGSKKYLLFAELTCSDGKHTTACNPTTGLSTLKAPGLDGECKWLSPNDNQPITETSAGKGAKPSGVELIDDDHVCEKFAKTDIIAKYDNYTKTWNNSPEAGTYTDVYYTASQCTKYSVVPVKCPDLKVTATAPDDVNCVNDGSSTTCKLNGKTMADNLENANNKLSNASEGCMDIVVDWQNANYPKGTQTLNIYVQCSYTGQDKASKTCKVTYNGKESVDANQTTSNAKCDTQHNFSIGTLKDVSKQTFNRVCMKVTEGGIEKDNNISCKLQIY